MNTDTGDETIEFDRWPEPPSDGDDSSEDFKFDSADEERVTWRRRLWLWKCHIGCSCLFASCCCPIFIIIVWAIAFTASLGKSDAAWLRYLDVAPLQLEQLADTVIARARAVAANLSMNVGAMSALPRELDLVCSGGGFMSMYFLGIQQVLAELARLNATVLHRMAGASGGTDVAFRLALEDDERHVALQNLAYGQVQVENPADFASNIKAALAADHHWRLLAHWLVRKYDAELNRLNGVVYASVSTFVPYPCKNVISIYSNGQQAREAFVMGGSFFLLPDAITKREGLYNGQLAGDGGFTDCAPHFSDCVRQQLVVTLMKTDLDTNVVNKVVAGNYNVSEAVAIMKKGQDDIASFLRGGRLPSIQVLPGNTTWDPFDCYGKSLKGSLLHDEVFYYVMLAVSITCCCCSCISWQIWRRKLYLKLSRWSTRQE